MNRANQSFNASVFINPIYIMDCINSLYQDQFVM